MFWVVGYGQSPPDSAGISWSWAGATADVFVVTKGCAAEDDIFHGALAGCFEAEGGDEEFDDPLTGFDVATDDGWGRGGIVGEGRIEETFREDEIDGIEEPFVERERFTDPETEDVEEGAESEWTRNWRAPTQQSWPSSSWEPRGWNQ